MHCATAVMSFGVLSPVRTSETCRRTAQSTSYDFYDFHTPTCTPVDPGTYRAAGRVSAKARVSTKAAALRPRQKAKSHAQRATRPAPSRNRRIAGGRGWAATRATTGHKPQLARQQPAAAQEARSKKRKRAPRERFIQHTAGRIHPLVHRRPRHHHHHGDQMLGRCPPGSNSNPNSNSLVSLVLGLI